MPMQKLRTYVLDSEGEPVRADIRQWERWLRGDTDAAVVERTEIGGTEVATAFTGVDRSGGRADEPLVYETAVWGGPLSGETEHYATREQAIMGHFRMCDQVARAQRGLRGLLWRVHVWLAWLMGQSP